MNLLSLLLGIAAVVFAVHSVQVRGCLRLGCAAVPAGGNQPAGTIVGCGCHFGYRPCPGSLRRRTAGAMHRAECSGSDPQPESANL